jgi:PAS domain S-box-containing protein
MEYPNNLFDDISDDAANNALLIIEDEQIVYASPAYMEMMGYKKDETLIRDLENIRAYIHPDDKEELDRVIQDALSNKRPTAHYTFREKNKQGVYILREDYAQYYYGKDGNHIRTYVICRDITDMPERKWLVDMMWHDLQVLIAEDNRMNMMLTHELVRQLFPNSIVREAWDGQQAIDAFSEQKPDLVLMDIQMPEKDGYQATNEIRKLEQNGDRKVPVIAITAKQQSGEKERCLEAGMNDYLPKPVDETEFRKVIIQHVLPYVLYKYQPLKRR